MFYICHSVTRASPLWGKGREELLAERGLLALTVVATDDQARAQGFPTLLRGKCFKARGAEVLLASPVYPSDSRC